MCSGKQWSKSCIVDKINEKNLLARSYLFPCVLCKCSQISTSLLCRINSAICYRCRIAEYQIQLNQTANRCSEYNDNKNTTDSFYQLYSVRCLIGVFCNIISLKQISVQDQTCKKGHEKIGNNSNRNTSWWFGKKIIYY